MFRGDQYEVIVNSAGALSTAGSSHVTAWPPGIDRLPPMARSSLSTWTTRWFTALLQSRRVHGVFYWPAWDERQRRADGAASPVSPLVIR